MKKYAFALAVAAIFLCEAALILTLSWRDSAAATVVIVRGTAASPSPSPSPSPSCSPPTYGFSEEWNNGGSKPAAWTVNNDWSSANPTYPQTELDGVSNGYSVQLSAHSASYTAIYWDSNDSTSRVAEFAGLFEITNLPQTQRNMACVMSAPSTWSAGCLAIDENGAVKVVHGSIDGGNATAIATVSTNTIYAWKLVVDFQGTGGNATITGYVVAASGSPSSWGTGQSHSWTLGSTGTYSFQLFARENSGSGDDTMTILFDHTKMTRGATSAGTIPICDIAP